MRINALTNCNSHRLAGFSAAVLLALAGTACTERNESLLKIEQAERTISVLTADGTFAHLDTEKRRKELSQLADSMNDLGANGPEGVKAAAYTIAARARAGLAALDAHKAADADKQLLAHLGELRAALNTFTLQRSIAEAHTGVGTQELISTLGKSIETNKAASAQAAQAAARIQARADELLTRAKAVVAQAQDKREQAASAAARAQGLSATEGLEVLKASASVKAEADALDQQAAGLNTELSLVHAELTRARSAVESLSEQAAQLQQNIAAARTRLAEEQNLAGSAGNAATAAATAFASRLGELNTFRSSSLDPAHQAAVTNAQKAVEMAKQATNKAASNPQSVAAGNPGKLSVAAAQQHYADALVSQARASGSLADTLSLAAGASPALPNAAELAAAADAARKTADDTLAQARELYGSIKESLDAIGDEKLKARLGATSQILGSLSSKQGVKPVEDGGGAGSGGGAGAGGGEAEVRRAIDAFHDKFRASGFDAAAEMFDFENDQQRQAMASMAALSKTVAAFDRACQDKLGVKGAQAAGPMLGMMFSMLDAATSANKDATASDYDVTVSGDSATATPKAGGPAQRLVKKDGRWLIAAPAELTSIDQGSLDRMSAFNPILTALTADINAGTITSPQQVQSTLMAKLGSLVRPPAGGGAGGGDDNK